MEGLDRDLGGRCRWGRARDRELDGKVSMGKGKGSRIEGKDIDGGPRRGGRGWIPMDLDGTSVDT
eukprot:scaffold431_cov334-Pavlova_lutheri.AAC.116